MSPARPYGLMECGSVEIVYAVDGSESEVPAREAGWKPASQRA
jgi:hypothetical protein